MLNVQEANARRLAEVRAEEGKLGEGDAMDAERERRMAIGIAAGSALSPQMIQFLMNSQQASEVRMGQTSMTQINMALTPIRNQLGELVSLLDSDHILNVAKKEAVSAVLKERVGLTGDIKKMQDDTLAASKRVSQIEETTFRGAIAANKLAMNEEERGLAYANELAGPDGNFEAVHGAIFEEDTEEEAKKRAQFEETAKKAAAGRHTAIDKPGPLDELSAQQHQYVGMSLSTDPFGGHGLLAENEGKGVPRFFSMRLLNDEQWSGIVASVVKACDTVEMWVRTNSKELQALPRMVDDESKVESPDVDIRRAKLGAMLVFSRPFVAAVFQGSHNPNGLTEKAIWAVVTKDNLTKLVSRSHLAEASLAYRAKAIACKYLMYGKHAYLDMDDMNFANKQMRAIFHHMRALARKATQRFNWAGFPRKKVQKVLDIQFNMERCAQEIEVLDKMETFFCDVIPNHYVDKVRHKYPMLDIKLSAATKAQKTSHAQQTRLFKAEELKMRAAGFGHATRLLWLTMLVRAKFHVVICSLDHFLFRHTMAHTGVSEIIEETISKTRPYKA